MVFVSDNKYGSQDFMHFAFTLLLCLLHTFNQVLLHFPKPCLYNLADFFKNHAENIFKMQFYHYLTLCSYLLDTILYHNDVIYSIEQ